MKVTGFVSLLLPGLINSFPCRLSPVAPERLRRQQWFTMIEFTDSGGIMAFRIGWMRLGALLTALGTALPSTLAGQSDHVQMAHDGGPINGGTYRLCVSKICAKVPVYLYNGEFKPVTIEDQLHKTKLTKVEPFAILVKERGVYQASDLAVDPIGISITELKPNADASRMAERIAGEQVDVPLASRDGLLKADWRLELRDGSNYIREFLTITAKNSDVPIERVQLIDANLPDAHVVGSVAGSPIVAGNWFLGFEHPMSRSKVTNGRATAWIDRELPLRAGQSVTYSAVIGVARTGQMRRDFLAYLERERAHPYRTFLHYNSWYDLGFGNTYDAAGALNRIDAFGHELVEKRGVKLDSFLFDDGWDNHNSLWKFNSGFPDGFAPIKTEAEKFGAEPGVWMSPWGGYWHAKDARIAFGRAAGL